MNEYKYVVTRETCVWSKTPEYDDHEFVSSSASNTTIVNDSLLYARKMALEMANNFVKHADEQPQSPETLSDVIYYTTHQVTVNLTSAQESLCIYDDGDGINDEELDSVVFSNLLKESSIYDELDIDTSEMEESVKFRDWSKVTNWDHEPDWDKLGLNEGIVLSNGFDWSDAQINLDKKGISLDSFRLLFADEPGVTEMKDDEFKRYMVKSNLEDNSSILQVISKEKRNKKVEFKTFIKNRITTTRDKVEIAIKTTGESIPAEIQEELNSLIQKWKKL
ncbi:MAG: hypothetical protein ACJ77K_19330 [Bacteroidia bacterium]